MSPLEKLIRYNLDIPFEQRKAILYCTERGKPIVGKLAEDFPSFAIGGLPGFGKSSAAAGFCCNMVMAGGELIVLDPHINAPRDSLGKTVAPLAHWLLLPTLDFADVDSEQIVSYFERIKQEYEARKRPNGTIGKKPLFVVVDEWSELLDMLDDDEYRFVIEVVSNVARGGRKFGMWICLLAQQWNLSATGGSLIRKNLTGRIAFHAEQAELRMVLNTRDTNALKDLCIPPMRPGDAIVKRPGSGTGMQRVKFLHTNRKACEAVAHLMQAVYADRDAKILHFPAKTPQPASPIPSPPVLQPIVPHNPFSPSHVGTSHFDLNIQSFSLNNLPIQHKKGVKITKEDIQVIIEEGNTQIRETGRVKRTLIRDKLNWNSHRYQKIQAVCDALGWDLSMSKDEIDPDAWEAIKKQYEYRCLKCGRQEPGITLEPDRIVPKVKGGSYEPGNVQPLCKQCNSGKRERIVDYRQETSHV